MRQILVLLVTLVFAGSVLTAQTAPGGQVPTVTSVVNSASYSGPVEPGSLITIFGSNLAATPQSANALPLPTKLGGTSVTISGLPAHLLFVSPGQINAQSPFMGVGFPGAAETVVVTAPGGTSQPATFPVFYVAPALFTADSSGCGQVVALNIRADGTSSANSPNDSAAPGDYIVLFGTGLGVLQHQPAEGSAATGSDLFSSSVEAYFGSAADSAYLGGLDQSAALHPAYSGAAPALVGVGQVNLQIPTNTRNGCAVPLALASGGALLSPTVTVSVNTNRGPCIDPPQQSYGIVSITKTIASGTAKDGETDEFQATFPAGPGLAQPPAALTPSPTWAGTIPALSSRACIVAGHTALSAGAIQIQTDNQPAVSSQPVSQDSGVSYDTVLPSGFVKPGSLTISSAANAPVVLRETMTVGNPISIQTKLTPGTALSATFAPAITWTGGDPDAGLRFTLIGNVNAVGRSANVFYVPANAGVALLPVVCLPGNLSPASTLCNFGVSSSGNSAELIIEVVPQNGVADSISAQGITQQVRFSWSYRYIFGGLSLTE